MIETTQTEVCTDNNTAEPKPNVLQEHLKSLMQLAATALIVVLINLFVCRFVIVSGKSMYPTLLNGDLLLVQIAAYEPKPGDILVCRTEEEGLLEGRYIVKRCIAVEGQTVLVDYDNNTITVDGVVLQEDYINQAEDPLDGFGRENVFYVIPKGHIFVLGDNRNHSSDSRTFGIGAIPVKDVLGGMTFHIPLGSWFK